MNLKHGTTSSLSTHLAGATMMIAAVCVAGCAATTTDGAGVNTAREPVPSYQCGKFGCTMGPTGPTQTAKATPLGGEDYHSRGHTGKD